MKNRTLAVTLCLVALCCCGDKEEKKEKGDDPLVALTGKSRFLGEIAKVYFPEAGAPAWAPVFRWDFSNREVHTYKYDQRVVAKSMMSMPGAENVRISGTFLARAFEGPYRNMGKWVKETLTFVKGRGKETKRLYFFYTTCPACAKYYGENYTVILAEV